MGRHSRVGNSGTLGSKLVFSAAGTDSRLGNFPWTEWIYTTNTSQHCFRDSPPRNAAGDRIYCLENVGMQSPGGYLGIEELGVNLLVGLPEELALFSEFKHRVCRRRRRNFLKRDIFSSVASPLLTTNSS